jgi:hypothetical protein
MKKHSQALMFNPSLKVNLSTPKNILLFIYIKYTVLINANVLNNKVSLI